MTDFSHQHPIPDDKRWGEKGQVFHLKHPLKALCCGSEFEVGQEVRLWKQTSVNRMIIEVPIVSGGAGLHKVKLSSLRRCIRD